MTKLALLALCLLSALTACEGASVRYLDDPNQDDEALRTYAADAWASVGVEAPETYKLLFLDPTTLLDACHVSRTRADGTPRTIGGCSFPGVVLLSNESPYELQEMQLTHELGHLLRGGHDGELDSTHLDCPETQGVAFPGHDVMCATAAPVGSFPTMRDAAFVQR